uniref:Uncharacterized protein n=1 Tax=Caenorhabditis japonica TaxID=281687 RepID=A0A8R1EE73_CAEJA
MDKQRKQPISGLTCQEGEQVEEVEKDEEETNDVFTGNSTTTGEQSGSVICPRLGGAQPIRHRRGVNGHDGAW